MEPNDGSQNLSDHLSSLFLKKNGCVAFFRQPISVNPAVILKKIVIVTGTILPVTWLSKRTGGIFNNVAGREVLKTWEIIIYNIIYYNTEKQQYGFKNRHYRHKHKNK
jgi:hypothetical protein